MKRVLIIFNIVFAICIIFIGINYFYKLNKINPFEIEKPSKTIFPTPASDISNKKPPLKTTELPLTLWGTIKGPIRPYAAIEDHQIKSQGLYKPGDVIQGAVIKEILKHSVILRHNNQDYILKNDLLKTQRAQNHIPKTSTTTIVSLKINQSTIDSLMKKTDSLKRQISIKPIVNKNKGDGFLIYRIRPDSFFYNLGLRNGDIIKKFNGVPINSLKDAADIYKNSNPADSFKLLLLRKGGKQELIYHIIPDEDPGAKRQTIQ